MQDVVAARLGLEKKRESRVAGDSDALYRVHLHGDGQGHGRPVEAKGNQSISSLYASGAWRGSGAGSRKATSGGVLGGIPAIDRCHLFNDICRIGDG